MTSSHPNHCFPGRLLILAVATLWLASCAGWSWFTGSPRADSTEALARVVALAAEAPAPAPAPFPHRPHVIGEEMACDDCHDVDDAGEPVLPWLSECFSCHPGEPPAAVARYFRTQGWQPEMTKEERAALGETPVRNARVSHRAGLRFTHAPHLTAEIDCAACHGEVGAREVVDRALSPTMDGCLDCHRERGVGVTCETCHDDWHRDQPPPSHDDAWIAGGRHGRVIEAGLWDEGRCALCHEAPGAWCDDCHRTRRPRSHDAPISAALRVGGWMGTHGAAQQADDARCARCHEQRAFCDRCHVRRAPADHTNTWRRTLHGAAAVLETERCEVCHRQDSCRRCHERTKPRSHRGGWGATAQRHCLSCHEPVADTDCQVCHQQSGAARSHARAPRLPRSPLDHALIPGPETCRECHLGNPQLGASRLRHPDNGDDCETAGCHRR